MAVTRGRIHAGLPGYRCAGRVQVSHRAGSRTAMSRCVSTAPSYGAAARLTMMGLGTIFSRYVFRQSAGALLLILLSLSGVVWIALALRQLNLVTTQGQETWMFVKMTLLALPNLMAL